MKAGKRYVLRVGKHLRRDPAVFLHTAAWWLKVRDRHGELVPLCANAAQEAFERRRGQRNIVLKARQMGMTTWIAARFFLQTITAQGVLTVQVAQNRQAAESIFRIVQRMWENLPASLRDGPLKRSRANVGQMIFPALDSEFRICSAADASAGRGVSIRYLHCSEVAHWPGDAAATLAGLRAALAPDGELVLESTPNGAYGAFYDEWQRATDEASPNSSETVRHFFPWWMESGYTREGESPQPLSEAEAELVARSGLSEGQIRFRRELEKTFGSLRVQEYAEDAETCFRATGDCCFDVASIEERMAEVAVVTASSQRNGALMTWMPPREGRQYIVAADTAGGGAAGDFAAVQVVDVATGMQCAELQEKLAPLELAGVCSELARLYNNALLVVERNNHGSAVLAYLATVHRYERLYMQAGQGGWLTTSVSKPEAVGRLGALLVERPALFASRRLLAECRTFVRGANGSTAGARGAHDDLVMAMAMAQSVRAEVLEQKGKR